MSTSRCTSQRGPILRLKRTLVLPSDPIQTPPPLDSAAHRGGACPQSLGFLNTSMRYSGRSMSQRDGDCQPCHVSARESPHRTDCPLVPWTCLVTAALLSQWLTSPLVHDRAGLTAALAQNSKAVPAGAFTTNAQLLRGPGGRRHWQIEL